MKINHIINETTTAGAVAPVSTPLGGTQTRGNPSIYGGKKVGSLFKGKKTSKPFANSLNESAMKDLAYDLQNMKPAEFQKKYGKTRQEMQASMSKQPKPAQAPVNEADLQEDDVILIPGQGRKSKTGFVPHGQSRVDHEVEMARSDLFSAAKNAQQVYAMIKDVSEDEGLEGWVQEKIIKANDYLNTVREYLEGKQVQDVEEADMSRRGFLGALAGGALAAAGLGAAGSAMASTNDPGFVRKVQEKHYEMVEKNPRYANEHQALQLPFARGISGASAETNKQWAIKTAQLLQKYGVNVNEGLAEGSRKAWLKHNDLVDIEKPLAGLKSEFEKFLQTHDPEEKRKYQQGIKQRIKSEPMSGPTGALPEGAKVDRMVKHITKSEKDLGHSKKEAENIAWATANKRGMLDNKNKKK